MRELKRTSFERSWNFMKANDKISLVISSVSLILLVLLHTPILFLLFNCGFFYRSSNSFSNFAFRRPWSILYMSEAYHLNVLSHYF